VDEGFMVLTDQNFDQVIRDYDNVMIMFTNEWCMKCKTLEVDLRSTAKQLSKEEPPIYVAKIDLTSNRRTYE
jgi:thiol:disulfide interchange protein